MRVAFESDKSPFDLRHGECPDVTFANHYISCLELIHFESPLVGDPQIQGIAEESTIRFV